MNSVVILSAGAADRSLGLVDHRPAESRPRIGWLRDVLEAAAEPGGIPPCRTRLAANRNSTG